MSSAESSRQRPRAGRGPSAYPARWAVGVTLTKPFAMLVGLALPAATMMVMLPALPFLALAYPFSALLAWPLSGVLPAGAAWEVGEIVAVFLVALVTFAGYRGVKRAVSRVAGRPSPTVV